MATETYTPGPWHWAGDALYSGKLDKRAGYSDSEQVFPFFDQDRTRGLNGRRHEADKRLIAAAPELLRICMAIADATPAHLNVVAARARALIQQIEESQPRATD